MPSEDVRKPVEASKGSRSQNKRGVKSDKNEGTQMIAPVLLFTPNDTAITLPLMEDGQTFHCQFACGNKESGRLARRYN